MKSKKTLHQEDENKFLWQDIFSKIDVNEKFVINIHQPIEINKLTLHQLDEFKVIVSQEISQIEKDPNYLPILDFDLDLTGIK